MDRLLALMALEMIPVSMMKRPVDEKNMMPNWMEWIVPVLAQEANST
jgi:hypothetical protein